MKKMRLAQVAAVGSVLFGVMNPVFAEESPGAPPLTVEERLEELTQKIRVLERNRELEQEDAEVKAKDAPVLVAGKEGFALKSADGAFQLKLRGYLQADGRFFLDDKDAPATDQFLLRRVRPILEGTVFRYVDFRIMPDFGNGKTELQDAYLNIRYFPALQLQAGKFKGPVGLERLQSGTDTLFVERGLPTNLVPNRDLGVQLHGSLADGAVAYAVGVFNGAVDGGSVDGDSNDDKEFSGRIFSHPFRQSDIEVLEGFGVGVAGSYGTKKGSPTSPGLPSYKTPAQEKLFSYVANSSPTSANTVVADGIHYRISPQGYYYGGPFGLIGEYVLSTQQIRLDKKTAELKNDAWQVAVSYVLSGEKASYKGVSPRNPFDPKKGAWGAVELKARYGRLNVDGDAFSNKYADLAKSPKSAQAYAGGINWYLNKNVRVAVDYEQTTFKGGAAGGKDRPDEKVLLSRFQLAF